MSWSPRSEGESLSVIRERAKEVFKKTPCLWQLKITEVFLKQDRDIVCIAGTGMGKTLTFGLPLLFRPTGTNVISARDSANHFAALQVRLSTSRCC